MRASVREVLLVITWLWLLVISTIGVISGQISFSAIWLVAGGLIGSGTAQLIANKVKGNGAGSVTDGGAS